MSTHRPFLKRHGFVALLLLVMFGAYTVGKDRALLDNERDRIETPR